jgi:hypothetical protein
VLAGRQVIVLVLAALFAAACSSGADPVADPPDSTSTTTVVASDVQASVIEAPDLAGEGGEPGIAQLSSVDGTVYAVGSVQSLRDGRWTPLVLRRDAGGWTRIAVDVPADAVGAEAVAAVSVGGRLVVYGTSSAAPGTGRGADLVAWSPEDGAAPLEVGGPVLGDGDQTVSHAAAGGAGVLVAGHDEGEAMLWASQDGTRFRTVSVPDGAVHTVNDVAVGADQAVALGHNGDGSIILAADLDEGTATVVHEVSSSAVSLTTVRAVSGRFVLGGGQTAQDGDERPVLWRSDGRTWPGQARQLPHTDAAGTSNRGHAVRDIDVRDGTLVASYGSAVVVGAADGEGPWQVATSDGLPDSATPSDVAVGAHGDVATRVVHGRKLLSYDGASWVDGAESVLPLPTTLEEPAGITHGDRRWVLATTVSPPDDTMVAQLWWSDDAKSWNRSEPLPAGDGTYVAAVGRSSDGFVVAGVHDATGDARIWRSADGVSWIEVLSPLLDAEDGGVRQPTRVLERPDGALLTGFRFDGTAILPYALHIGTDGSVTDVSPPPGSRPDTVTVGLCEHEGQPVLTGGSQDTDSRVAWWIRRTDAWTPVETDVVGSMWSCASVDDRLLGFASTRDGPVVGELRGDFAGTPLPGPGTFDVSDVVVAAAGPVLFGEGGGNAWMWLGDPDVVPASEGWTLVRPEALGGVGVQRFVGAATDDEGRLLVLLADGATTRLVRLELQA